MRKYVLAALPLGLGLALAVVWRLAGWPDPVLYLRADVATAVLLLGIVLSLAGALLALTWAQANWRAAGVLAQAQQDEAEAHRRFIRRLDHELKNPLTAMRIVLANSAARDDDPTIAAVRSQVDRIARVSADLRKLADLEAQPLEVEPVDVAELLTELAETVRKRPEPAAQRLQLVLPRAPWPLSHVAGDRDLLFLALHNLLDNACKFVRAEDTIEVRAIEDGAAVLIEVADTGPGVPEDDLPHLGEELYRGSAPRSVEGSGLGLALVRAIVNRHGGAMAIRSRLGKGTVVSLRLPVAR
jgi:two-component system, OmpR family, sensor kinase